METFPPELVEQIFRHLPAQDLVSCSAVSRTWREIANQDWLWKPHCDPELEEHLRTTPCVVKPAFKTPEVPDSTLTPICKWKLAFMREKHLWRNWKRKNVQKKEFQSTERLSVRSFLTDTLIVTVSENSQTIDVWDVSVSPASVVATVSLGRFRYRTCSTVGNRWILIYQFTSINFFCVDITNKSITLEHTLHIDDGFNFFFTKKSLDGGHFLLAASGSDLIIYDIEKGEVMERVCCPVENQRESVEILRINDIPTSDDILVLIENKGEAVLPYIYSLKQQLYLPVPISEALTAFDGRFTAVNDHYVCLGCSQFLVIVDYHTSEVLFKDYEVRCMLDVLAFNDSFIFVDEKPGKYCLKMFSIMNRSITSNFEYVFVTPPPQLYDVKAVNNKFLIFYDVLQYERTSVVVIEPYGQALKEVDAYCPPFDRVINKSSTRSFEPAYRGSLTIDYYW